MSELDHKIIEILKNHPQGLKAREIADLLGADRKTINSRLYSNDYKKTCVCDSKYVWRYIKKDAKTNSLIVPEEQDKINTDHDLVNLCNYYLECLALENSEGVSVYQISKFSLDYAEIGAIEDYKSNQSVQNLISKVSRSNKSFSTYLGYPVLIRELTSKTGNRFRMVSPVLLFNIDTKGGTVETSRFPIINIDAIKNYSANNAQEAFSELLNLSNELGLNNPDQDFDLNEIALKLQSIREWEWKEDLDPDELDTDVSVKDTNVPGVYNKAVVVAVERKPFTLGLENELAALKEIDQNSYKESALY